jgi:hypothetical protein
LLHLRLGLRLLLLELVFRKVVMEETAKKVEGEQ